jgi:hypothetical protein
MPWKERSPLNERVKFVAAMLEAEETFGELCERSGIGSSSFAPSSASNEAVLLLI